ncbi:hypothetical protein E2C01_036209 [Portunus trituberculatus]|uniref:Uncharacterized protein n=1 Tax=Portunus trituberculatus TaxID=210409 RepID=A0A5B7FBA8_PORTR|nr:hypothetical protein [Portunus trituberculatus]
MKYRRSESDGSNPIPPRSVRAGRSVRAAGRQGKNMIIWIRWETAARRPRLACCRKMLSEIQDRDKRIYECGDLCSSKIYECQAVTQRSIHQDLARCPSSGNVMRRRRWSVARRFCNGTRFVLPLSGRIILPRSAS